MIIQATDSKYYQSPEICDHSGLFTSSYEPLLYVPIGKATSEIGYLIRARKWLQKHNVKALLKFNDVTQMIIGGIRCKCAEYSVHLLAPLPKARAWRAGVDFVSRPDFGWTLPIKACDLLTEYRSTTIKDSSLAYFLGVSSLEDLRRALRRGTGLTAKEMLGLEGERLITLMKPRKVGSKPVGYK